MRTYLALAVFFVCSATAQVPSQVVANPGIQPIGKPVARVNGTVLTDHDLLREMYTIFPYARQHNGFPQAMEADIRKGAMQMIVFEELLYQEALQRKLGVTPARLDQAAVEFRKQFPTQQDYEQFLKSESYNSTQQLKSRIRRSLLIERMMDIEINNRSTVPVLEAKAYFDKNPNEFRNPESWSIQTISILIPANTTPAQLKDVRKRAEDALRQAKATKGYEPFGLLAEKISEDDFHVMMGDHRAVDETKLPPPVVQAARRMKAGEVSDLIQIDQAYTIIRLNAHTPASMQKFAQVKDSLSKQLQKRRIEQLRAGLDKRLRAKAKVEVL